MTNLGECQERPGVVSEQSFDEFLVAVMGGGQIKRRFAKFDGEGVTQNHKQKRELQKKGLIPGIDPSDLEAACLKIDAYGDEDKQGLVGENL